MTVWQKLRHLLPWVRRAEDDDIRRELDALREIAGPGQLGNVTLAAENARETFRWLWLERLLQDLRYARRSMWHDKLFTLLTVSSLALGIGASTAIYSFMDSIMLRALPVAHPEALAVMKWRARSSAISSQGISWSTGGSTSDANGRLTSSFPYPALALFERADDVVASAFGYYEAEGLNVSVGSETTEAAGHFVTGGYFPTMGIAPAAGRLMNESDDRIETAPVVVISQAFARRHFGDISRAPGQVIRVNDKPFEIVGVVPPSFFGAEPGEIPDLYMPMQSRVALGFSAPTDFTTLHFYWMDIMVRLRPGVTVAAAEAALAPRFHQFVADSALNDKQRQDLPVLEMQSGVGGLDSLRREYAQPILVLMAVVGGILLIACSNVANLLLARAAARRREIAIRLSIGAGRGRVVRQLLTESVLLSSIAGAFGLWLAWWSIPVLTALLSNGRGNFTLHADLNWRVLSVAVGLSTLPGLLFGLAPALQGTRVDLTSSLKALPAGELRSGRSRTGIARGLVVIQIALSLLLLVSAGLFGRTLSNLHGINVGFNRDNVLLFTLRPGAVGIIGPARNDLFENVRMRLDALPGVVGASLSARPLPMGGGTSMAIGVVGMSPPRDARGDPPYSVILSVGPDFFRTMQIPILAGREFTERDRGVPKVVVVNREFARLFGLANPVGETLASRVDQFTVVGMVDDALSFALKEDQRPSVYFPYLQADTPASGMTFAVRTAGKPMGLVASVSGIVRSADWRLAVLDPRTAAAHIDNGISREITLARLCSAFAAVALLIASIGLYGMVAFTVARRTNEIGIRIALGASRRRVIWMVLRDVIVTAAAGFAIGLPFVFLGTRYVKSFLYGITPNDPAAIVMAIAVLLLSALVAGLVPARRAASIAPMGAVRSD